MARPADPAGGDPRVPPDGQTAGIAPGRVARQLSDQPRDGQSRRCARNRSPRWATRSIAPKRWACSASCCIPGCYTEGSEAARARADRRGARRCSLRDRRRGRTMVILEHTAGQGTSLGATFEQLATIIGRMKDGSAASASASTPAICSRPATTSRQPRAMRARSTDSGAWSASIA